MVNVTNEFVASNTNFTDLVEALRKGFSSNSYLVPMRHHYDFPVERSKVDSTLLLMPAWNPDAHAGVKVVTVSPENKALNLPAIHGVYLYIDSQTGKFKAIFEAEELTAKRNEPTP